MSTMKKLSLSTSIFILFTLLSFTLEGQDCLISELEIAGIECVESDSFYITISFEAENTGNEGFRIVGNGQEYGQFEYGNENYQLGPMLADCETHYEFVVIDNEIDNCSNFIELNENACCEEDCFILVKEVSLEACDSLGYRNLEFYVDSEGGSERGFEISFNGVPVERFKYDMNPYNIMIPSNNQSIVFTVQDLVNRDCITRFDFRNEECDAAVDCFHDSSSGYIITTVEFECTSDSSYLAYATFQENLLVDSLWLTFFYHESNDYNGSFKYRKRVSTQDFPYLLGEFEHSNMLYYYFLTDHNNIFCYTGNEWNDAPDCSEHDDCSINDLVIEAQECTTASGTIYVDLAFKVENPESSGFLVRGNGVIYDTFVYGQVYYTIGPILADCKTNYEFIVRDIEDADCYAEAYFEEPPCCDANMECEIYDLVVDPGQCHEDGSYTLWIDFEYEYQGNDFFEVFAADNQLIGYFALDTLPLLIDRFPGRDAEYDIITICINDVPECCETIEFMGPECEQDGECGIFELFAEAYECTDANTFMLDLEFEYKNPGDLGFAVLVNGVIVDTFQYGFTYYTVGPFERMCDQLTEVKVIDFDNDCYDVFTFDYAVCCDENEPCQIDSIRVYGIECNNDGTYNLSVDFDYENNTNAFFDLWSGNTFVGYYAYADLPVRIENFPLRDAVYQLIKICDNDNPHCCAIEEFMGPDCDDSNERCPIADLELVETVIHAEGELLLIFDFHIDIDAPVNLDMYVNGEYYSTELNIVPPFEFRYLDGVPDRMHIKMCLEDHPDCCLETVVELEQPVECELYELTAIQTLCDDGHFYLVIDASHGFENTDYIFELRGNGMNHGHYSFADLPIALGPFHEEDHINEMALIVPGIDDCYLATALDISCECTTSIIEINSEEFNVSETNTEIRIESSSMQSYKLEIYTVDGRQVLATETYGSYVLRKTNFQTGIYILRISYQDAQKSFKIFIKN